MKLAVVIVNYRTARHVLQGLEHTVPQVRALGDAAIFVVDNCSPDDSVAVLRAGIEARGYGDCVRLIPSPVNGGFGAGNNVAFRASLASDDPAECFFLLNPDAWPEPGCLRALLSFLDEHPAVGIAGGRMRDEQGTEQASTFRFPTPWSELEGHLRLGVVTRLLREHVVARAAPERSGPVDWVSGASMVIRRRVVEQVGMFDEGFFLYFEEVDLCRRAHEADVPIWFVREAGVVHIGGVATGESDKTRRVPEYWFASRARYLNKAFGPQQLLATNLVAASAFALHRARTLLGRNEQRTPHYLRDFVRFNFVRAPRRAPGGGAERG